MSTSPVKQGFLTEIAQVESQISALQQRLSKLRQHLKAFEEDTAETSHSLMQKSLMENLFGHIEVIGPTNLTIPDERGKHFKAIRSYFYANGNEWLTAEQIGKALDIPQSSARDVLGRVNKQSFEAKQEAENLPKYFRLAAIELTRAKAVELINQEFLKLKGGRKK